MSSNKELKLTKPSQDGASQLNSVFCGRVERPHAGFSWLGVADCDTGTPDAGLAKLLGARSAFGKPTDDATSLSKVEVMESESRFLQSAGVSGYGLRAWSPRYSARRRRCCWSASKVDSGRRVRPVVAHGLVIALLFLPAQAQG
jgi:hypothetical protein